MNLNYAWPEATGAVERAGSGPTLPAGAIELPEGVQAVDAPKYRMVNGAWVARTVVPLPNILPEGDGLLILYPDVPAGTVCEVYDLDPPMRLGTVEADRGALEIRLIDQGSYRFELRPPVTHLPHIWDLTL